MEQRLHHQFTRAAVQLDGCRHQLAAAFLSHQTRPAAAVSCWTQTDFNQKNDNETNPIDHISTGLFARNGVGANQFTATAGDCRRPVQTGLELTDELPDTGMVSRCEVDRKSV